MSDMKKIAAYLTMCFIWGTTWMAIKIGLEDMTPFFSLGMRYLIAGSVLLFYLLIVDRKIRFQKEQYRLMIFITLFNYAIPYALVYWGEQFIFSDLCAVIFAMLPVNVAILSYIFMQEEKFSPFDIIGITISFCGIITIFSETIFNEIGFHFYGMIAIYLSSVSQAVMTIILKKYKSIFHPVKINVFPMFATGILITVASFLIEDVQQNHLTRSGIISIFYLAIFGTVIAFGLYFWLIRLIRLSILTSMTYVFPVISIVVGWIFLNERLSFIQIIGSLFILVGVFLTTRKTIRKKQAI